MNIRKIIEQQWFSFVFLLPFIVMFVLHEVMGFSDALLGRTGASPGWDNVSSIYNVVMGLAFYGGIAGYLAHCFSLRTSAMEKGTLGNHHIWLTCKLVVLFVCACAL